MLVLNRKADEDILVGDSVRIRVCGVMGRMVALGISAPPDVPIDRAEVRASKELSGSTQPSPLLTVDATETAIRQAVRDLIAQLFGRGDKAMRTYQRWLSERMEMSDARNG